jgi:hypothetical protein
MKKGRALRGKAPQRPSFFHPELLAAVVREALLPAHPASGFLAGLAPFFALRDEPAFLADIAKGPGLDDFSLETPKKGVRSLIGA